MSAAVDVSADGRLMITTDWQWNYLASGPFFSTAATSRLYKDGDANYAIALPLSPAQLGEQLGYWNASIAATDMSADGTVILGRASNPYSDTPVSHDYWLLTIPEPRGLVLAMTWWLGLATARTRTRNHCSSS